jgi:hypothetical protein
MAKFDAILIPGGGLTRAGGLMPMVSARLDRALEQSADFYIPLSASTTHLPPPLDARGYPIHEAVAAAEYLRERGVDERSVLAETSSYDTIGNAFFARTIHTDPRGLRRLLIVNSAFHMPRTEAIFRWMFGAAPDAGYDLSFESTADIGMSADALASRAERERASLASVRQLSARYTTLRDIHAWMYAEHGAYAWFLRGESYRPLPSNALSETYGGAK